MTEDIQERYLMGGCERWKCINAKELKFTYLAQTIELVEGSKIEYSKCKDSINFASTENKTSLWNMKCSGHFSPTFFFFYFFNFFFSFFYL